MLFKILINSEFVGQLLFERGVSFFVKGDLKYFFYIILEIRILILQLLSEVCVVFEYFIVLFRIVYKMVKKSKFLMKK